MINTDGVSRDPMGAREIQSGQHIYAEDAGNTDAYAISLSPALQAYTKGLQINFMANTVNTGAASLNVNGLGAKAIKKDCSSELEGGEINPGQIMTVIYDGTYFQIPTNGSVLL
jgi:hypothetical protein